MYTKALASSQDADKYEHLITWDGTGSCDKTTNKDLQQKISFATFYSHVLKSLIQQLFQSRHLEKMVQH